MGFFCPPVFIILALFLIARIPGVRASWAVGTFALTFAFWPAVFFVLVSRPFEVLLEPFAGTPWVFVVTGILTGLAAAVAMGMFRMGVAMRSDFLRLTLVKYILALMLMVPAVYWGEFCAPMQTTSSPPPGPYQCGAFSLLLERHPGWSGILLLGNGNPFALLLYLSAAYLLACTIVFIARSIFQPRPRPDTSTLPKSPA